MDKAAKNMENMYNWLSEDGITDVQIVENGTDEKLYFWPVPKVEEGEIFCGFFFRNKLEAEQFREYLQGTNTLLFLDKSIQENFDYLYINLISEDDAVRITVEPMGSYRNDRESVPDEANRILNFFNRDSISFEDMSLMYKTDLNISEQELENLLLSAIGYYQDKEKSTEKAYISRKSLKSGNQFYVLPTRIDKTKKNSLASFMIVKQEDLADKLELARLMDSQRIDLTGCLVFMVVSRQGKLKFVDVALQDYESMDRDTRRDLVLDFLNSIKNSENIDINKVKQNLIDKDLLKKEKNLNELIVYNEKDPEL